MGWVIVLVAVIVIAIAAFAWWKRSHKAAPPAPAPRPTRVADPTPMTGLEVALDQVTDRSGRNMRDKIEGGTTIDELRIPDDTGPILRRALDNVEQNPPSSPASMSPSAEPAEGDAPPAEG